MLDQVVLSERASEALAFTRAVVDAGSDTRALDALVQRATLLAGAASGHLSMLIDQQVTASAAGALAAQVDRGHETPFEDTICANALRVEGALVIPDTAADERVAGLPAVANGVVAAYLGAPLRSSSGMIVGVLCVIDDHPRVWTAQELADVSDIADEIVTELRRILDEAG
jgi:GAF domain-containing protein